MQTIVQKYMNWQYILCIDHKDHCIDGFPRLLYEATNETKLYNFVGCTLRECKSSIQGLASMFIKYICKSVIKDDFLFREQSPECS